MIVTGVVDKVAEGNDEGEGLQDAGVFSVPRHRGNGFPRAIQQSASADLRQRGAMRSMQSLAQSSARLLLPF